MKKPCVLITKQQNWLLSLTSMFLIVQDNRTLALTTLSDN
jgi:hypothetical protein